MKYQWHNQTIPNTVKLIATDLANGLSTDEATLRLSKHGSNTLHKGKRVSAWMLFASQFKNLVIWVLIGAAAVSIALDEWVDGSAILAIVVLNAIIGFFQEYRAEKAVAALSRLTAPKARVVRNGHAVLIPSVHVVPGDILLLEPGDLVAADARLIEAASLRSAEAPLTGESLPVNKSTTTIPAETALADRNNMIFLGTSITAGTGRAIVVATGMETEVGHIARLLQSASSDETPLQRRLDQVGRRLLWICLGIVALVFSLGWLRAHDPLELLLGAVSLAVAAIPEGLPAVVTVALALGVQRMARRNALVRRLPAVETLGCTQVICTDKTGTLTVGAMTVSQVVTPDHQFEVSGEGYVPHGAFFADGLLQHDNPNLANLLTAATACNDAELIVKNGNPDIVGDPTEAALLVAAAKWGIQRADIENTMPKQLVLPFDSERKRMTIVRRSANVFHAFVKGAPEVILERCTHIHTSQGIRRITTEERTAMAQASNTMANNALRVLAVAERTLDKSLITESPDAAAIEQALVFLGLFGLQDPPRAEARVAVARCKRAGIKTVMITGDHPDTASAIAKDLGILAPDHHVVLGSELEKMDDDTLLARVEKITVYARVSAEHKLRIVRAWKAAGKVVAMTGDGVNDAPSIKEASIGIAMGITGTEVTKKAADFIIVDDNFASIVAAVEEGRGIYDNITKTLTYLLGGNAGELAVMLFAALMGMPLPLLALHLLWINLITDGFPALALATDPIDSSVLERPPRDPKAELLDFAFLKLTLFTGFLTASVTLAAFSYEYYLMDASLEQARNAAFTTLVFAELLRSFGARSNTKTIWEIGLFSNKPLFIIVALGFLFQYGIYQLPIVQTLFNIDTITLAQYLAWAGLGFIPLIILEFRKLIHRAR